MEPERMPQRLLLKLGVIFLAGAMGSGAALASEEGSPAATTSPGVSAEQQSAQDVVITTSDDAAITVSSTTSQSQSVVGSSQSSTDAGSAAAVSAGAGLEATASDLEAKSAVLNDDTLSGTPVHGASSLSGGFTSAGAEKPSVQAAAGAKAENQVRVALAWAAYQMVTRNVAALQPIAPIELTPLSTGSNLPALPQNPTGWLGDLRVLLTSSLLPLLGELVSQPGSMASAVTLLSLKLILLILLVIAASLLLLDFYTARLRRSGYTDAARSDA
ncbi:MAG TPA: hypothetical protein VF272_01660, partial [Candidatus Saccharimonadia bacterium]